MLSIFIQHSSAKLAMRRSLCRLCHFSSLLRRNNAIQGTGAKQHQAEQKKLQSNFEAAVAACLAVHCNSHVSSENLFKKEMF